MGKIDSILIVLLVTLTGLLGGIVAEMLLAVGNTLLNGSIGLVIGLVAGFMVRKAISKLP